MPWNSDDEGGKGPWGQGGGKGGNNGENPSPWGNGGKRPNNNWGNGGNRGPGGLPPDLDELLKRGKDSLKQAIPGGGSGKGAWLLPVLALAAFVVYNSVYQVQPDERGVVMHFGKYSRTVEPGLHLID